MRDRVWDIVVSSRYTAAGSADNRSSAGRMRSGLCWGKPYTLVALALVVLLSTACAAMPSTSPATDSPAEMVEDHARETLPELSPSALGSDELLRVVATTNIIADVVAQVGGDVIELVPLLPVGADPHSYVPAPADLVSLNEAHVVFVNGLGLEESFESILDGLDGGGAVVSVNAGIDSLAPADDMHDHEDEGLHDEGEEHDGEEAEHHDADEHHDAEEHHVAGEEHHQHGAVDPHTWFSTHVVEQWVENVEHVLGGLDPGNLETYEANAATYLAELEALASELEDKVAEVPVEQRKLVTDHESFGYFADEYGFEVVGTLIPGLSTLAEPSAGELAALQNQIEQEGVRAIFVGSSMNPSLAEQIAADTGIDVVVLYTGSLSEEEGPASTYVDFMRYNTTAIVDGLK